MNFFTSFLLLSSIAGLASASSSSSRDIDGELSIEKYCGDIEVELECEWEAKASRKLRRRRRLTQVRLPNSHRILDVELDDVECYLEVDDNDFQVELHFPEDFTIEKREADDEDDFFVFVAEIKFDGTDVVGEIEVEIKDVDDAAVYDDSSISVDCP
jgi:hypothetical protein